MAEHKSIEEIKENVEILKSSLKFKSFKLEVHDVRNCLNPLRIVEERLDYKIINIKEDNYTIASEVMIGFCKDEDEVIDLYECNLLKFNLEESK